MLRTVEDFLLGLPMTNSANALADILISTFPPHIFTPYANGISLSLEENPSAQTPDPRYAIAGGGQ
jgi:hypothetical protein